MDPEQKSKTLIDAADVLNGASAKIQDASSKTLEAELCLEGVLAAHAELLEALDKVGSVVRGLQKDLGLEQRISFGWEAEARDDGLAVRPFTILKRVADYANGVTRASRISKPGEKLIAAQVPIRTLKDFEKLTYGMLAEVYGAGITTLFDIRTYFESKGITLGE